MAKKKKVKEQKWKPQLQAKFEVCAAKEPGYIVLINTSFDLSMFGSVPVKGKGTVYSKTEKHVIVGNYDCTLFIAREHYPLLGAIERGMKNYLKELFRSPTHSMVIGVALE